MKNMITFTRNDWDHYRKANRHVDIPLFEVVKEGYIVHVLEGSFQAYNIQKDWIAFEEIDFVPKTGTPSATYFFIREKTHDKPIITQLRLTKLEYNKIKNTRIYDGEYGYITNSYADAKLKAEELMNNPEGGK